MLSGVAQTEKRVACGKNLIAQMLCGSSSARVTKLGLNRLSTFGLLWQLKQLDVVTLIDLLVANGCLEQEEVNRFRPVVRLTALGGEVMRGTADVAGLNLPRELRLKLRRPVANKPESPGTAAPTTASDLHEAAALPAAADVSRDASRDDAWVIGLPPPECEGFETGFEPANAELVGNGDSNTLQSGLASDAALDAPPAYYWTWLLLSKGFSAEECLTIRGIARETLRDHVFQAAENGLALKAGVLECLNCNG